MLNTAGYLYAGFDKSNAGIGFIIAVAVIFCATVAEDIGVVVDGKAPRFGIAIFI
jgi:uncharacterized membrane protein